MGDSSRIHSARSSPAATTLGSREAGLQSVHTRMAEVVAQLETLVQLVSERDLVKPQHLAPLRALISNAEPAPLLISSLDSAARLDEAKALRARSGGLRKEAELLRFSVALGTRSLVHPLWTSHSTVCREAHNRFADAEGTAAWLETLPAALLEQLGEVAENARQMLEGARMYVPGAPRDDGFAQALIIDPHRGERT